MDIVEYFLAGDENDVATKSAKTIFGSNFLIVKSEDPTSTTSSYDA
jgi:hypothetical protein